MKNSKTIAVRRALGPSQFAEDVARKVAIDNAVRIYNLGRTLVCHRPGTRAEKAMWVQDQALTAHLGHGDHPGVCGR